MEFHNFDIYDAIKELVKVAIKVLGDYEPQYQTVRMNNKAMDIISEYVARVISDALSGKEQE